MPKRDSLCIFQHILEVKKINKLSKNMSCDPSLFRR